MSDELEKETKEIKLKNEYAGLFSIEHIHIYITRCRDGVNVLWCRSHLVWLVFEGSIPTCACFHLENYFIL